MLLQLLGKWLDFILGKVQDTLYMSDIHLGFMYRFIQ